MIKSMIKKMKQPMAKPSLFRHCLGKVSALLLVGILLAACSDDQGEKKEIVFGLGPSIYVNQVEGGIIPYLEDKGYQVSIKTFSQNSMIPPALKEGAVDVSVHISTANLHEMNRRLGGDAMMVWADTPSAPQTIRSLRHHHIDDIKDGMTIAIPSDPVSSERAARLLESVGWIQLSPDIDVSTFHVNEIKPGSITPKIVEMESALMLRALQDIDFAVVNGNFVTNAGERIQDGLAIEDSPEEHLVKVAILEKNQNETWAKDIQEAYESKAFEDFIKADPIYEGLIFPKAWSQ